MTLSPPSFVKTVLILTASMIVMACTAAALTSSEMETADFGSYPTDYQEMIEGHFSKQLRDPQSAVYEFTKPIKAKSGGEYGYRVEFYVNAKNSFGGYAGKELRHVFIRNDVLTETDVFSDSMYNKFAK